MTGATTTFDAGNLDSDIEAPKVSGDRWTVLANRAATGEEEARIELVEAALPSVRNLVRYLVSGDAEVDDLAQDALVVVLQRLPTYRAESQFSTWLHGVVVSVTLGSLRKRRRRERLAPHAKVPQLELIADVTVPADTYVERRELAKMLDCLPEVQRHALVLHYLVEMTVPEVAVALEVPEETVRSRLRLGRNRLREMEGAQS